MPRITYTEATPDQAQAAEILIPAIVVKDADGNVCGTVGLTMENVTKRDAKTGEQVPTGATRAMAAFTPARQGDRRFSVRETHMRAACAALGSHLGFVVRDTDENGAILLHEGDDIVAPGEDTE
jgi:hypothetical protein